MYSTCVNMVWGFRDVVQIMFFCSAYLEDKNIRTGGGVISSYFLEDGSFIKLENVTLGYNFYS